MRMHHSQLAALASKARGYFGWLSLGENVAAGQTSVDQVATAWMNSSGHKANILGKGTHAGFAQATGANGVIYWTQGSAPAAAADLDPLSALRTPDIDEQSSPTGEQKQKGPLAHSVGATTSEIRSRTHVNEPAAPSWAVHPVGTRRRGRPVRHHAEDLHGDQVHGHVGHPVSPASMAPGSTGCMMM